jgi:uncharacterized membrane protein
MIMLVLNFCSISFDGLNPCDCLVVRVWILFVMPFTISHAVLALPLAKLFKHQLPIAGLAIGCMA